MGWNDKVENMLGVFTRTGAFGDDTFIFTPAVGDSQTFSGIWSATYLEVDPEQGIQVMTDDPNVGARISDFAVQPKKGDLITYKGNSYKIRAPEPDGEGGITLVLENQIGR